MKNPFSWSSRTTKNSMCYVESLEEPFEESDEYRAMLECMTGLHKRLKEDLVEQQIKEFNSQFLSYTEKEQVLIDKRRAEVLEFSHKRINKMLENSQSEDLKSLKNDVVNYTNLCVFNFGDANVLGLKFWEWVQSLRNDSSKVYFGFDGSLARTLLFEEDKVPNQKKLKKKRKVEYRSKDIVRPNGEIIKVYYDSTLVPAKKTRELPPHLHKIASVLDADDVGLILTNLSLEEVKVALGKYSEEEYLDPLEPAPLSLVYEKDEFLHIPPSKIGDHLFFLTLQRLGMPVDLSGKLTETFSVCEEGEFVKENCAEILKLLERKVVPFFVRLVCHWDASTGVTCHSDFPDETCASCSGAGAGAASDHFPGKKISG